MARDDLFRRSFEAGTAFLDMTRERAEALVKELVKAGEVQREKAQKAIDELLERSRKGAEEVREMIRREVADQISSLGLATKEDIARLEAKLGGARTSETAAPGRAPAAGKGTRARKAAATSKVATSKAATSKAAAGTGRAAAASPSPRKAPPNPGEPPSLGNVATPEPGSGGPAEA